MPLMKPEIQDVLRAAGLAGPRKDSSDGRTLNEKLDAAGLSLEETLEELASIAKSTMNDGLRVRCLETVLKAHGALKETPSAVPSFTIVINPSSSSNPTSSESSVNHPGVPSSVNPILLPRQLLKELSSNSNDPVN